MTKAFNCLVPFGQEHGVSIRVIYFGAAQKVYQGASSTTWKVHTVFSKRGRRLGYNLHNQFYETLEEVEETIIAYEVNNQS